MNCVYVLLTPMGHILVVYLNLQDAELEQLRIGDGCRNSQEPAIT